MDERERRAYENEALFREVNDRIEELAAAPEPTLSIVCECGRSGCAERIAISRAEYDRLRSETTTFAVVPGHAQTAFEEVVERHEGYDVVRKLHGDPARLPSPRPA